MNTTIENIQESELSQDYRNGYDHGYNDGVNNIYNPRLLTPDYLEGYNDGQTDVSEVE